MQAKNYNQVRIDKDLYPIISDMANKDDRSITKQVNRLLRQALGGLQPVTPTNPPIEFNGYVQEDDTPPGPVVVGAKLSPPKPTVVEGTPEYAEKKRQKKIASEPSAQSKDFAPIALDEVEAPNGGASNVGLELACCSNPNPCKHWTWVGESQVWKNTLSGREKSNE